MHSGELQKRDKYIFLYTHFRLSRSVFYNTLIPMIEISQNNTIDRAKKQEDQKFPLKNSYCLSFGYLPLQILIGK